jgi:hypothetical protein
MINPPRAGMFELRCRDSDALPSNDKEIILSTCPHQPGSPSSSSSIASPLVFIFTDLPSTCVFFDQESTYPPSHPPAPPTASKAVTIQLAVVTERVGEAGSFGPLSCSLHVLSRAEQAGFPYRRLRVSAGHPPITKLFSNLLVSPPISYKYVGLFVNPSPSSPSVSAPGCDLHQEEKTTEGNSDPASNLRDPDAALFGSENVTSESVDIDTLTPADVSFLRLHAKARLRAGTQQFG